MDNIERDLKQMFERRSSDVGLSGPAPASLRRRARLQRFVSVSSGLFLVFLILAGGFVALRHIITEGAVTQVSNGHDFKVPPTSLLRKVPARVRSLISPGLVLLYQQGTSYVAYSEGVFFLSCPMGASPRACVVTAQRSSIPGRGEPGAGQHAEFAHSSDAISLPHLDSNVKVLWRGTPRSGSIGINSPGACNRIARFQPEFTCNGGAPVFRPHRTDTVQVPLVVGMQVDRAVRRVKAAGLTPVVVGSTPHGPAKRAVSLCDPLHTCPAIWVRRNKVIVVQQSVLPGTQMQRDSKVRLQAGLRHH
jgi:hypothetical protein